VRRFITASGRSDLDVVANPARGRELGQPARGLVELLVGQGECTVMDRHEQPRAQVLEREQRVERRHVAVAKRLRHEAADRQHRDIGLVALAEVGKAREVAAVAAQEQARTVAAHDVGEAARELVAAVRGRGRDHLDAADLEVGAGLELDDAREAEARHPRRGAGGDDDRRGARQLLQRRDVQVIGVAVRDQDEAAVGEVTRREPGLDGAPHPADPPPEHRVEADREPVVAGEHRRVAAERERELAGRDGEHGLVARRPRSAKPARDPVADEAAVALHREALPVQGRELAGTCAGHGNDPNNDRFRECSSGSR